jgi:hypothetical protein
MARHNLCATAHSHAGRRIDHLQHLGGRGLALQRLVTLGFALGKLMFQISYQLLGMD